MYALIMKLVATGKVGKEVITRSGMGYIVGREEAHYGHDGVTYRCKGRRCKPQPWTSSPAGRYLEKLRRIVNARINRNFNYCVVSNLEPGDSVGLHSEEVPGLQSTSPVATLSLGAPRPRVFHLRESGVGTCAKRASRRRSTAGTDLLCTPGSLYVRSQAVRDRFDQEVPERMALSKSHVSVTFCEMQTPV